MNADPRKRPELPTIDILILEAFLGSPQIDPTRLAKELGEHHSRVTEWCEKFRKAGLLSITHSYMDRQYKELTLYTAKTPEVVAFLAKYRKK